MLKDKFGGGKFPIGSDPEEVWRELLPEMIKDRKFIQRYWCSNYGRVACCSLKEDKPNKLLAILESKRKYSVEEYIRYSYTTQDLNTLQSALLLKNLVGYLFPELKNTEDYNTRFIARDKTVNVTPGYYKYYSYNIYNKEIIYYRNQKEVQKKVGISEEDLERLLKNQIPPFKNLKFYMT